MNKALSPEQLTALFLQGEWIKRHFEYYGDPEDIEWAKKEWDKPINEHPYIDFFPELDVLPRMNVINDFIMYIHKLRMGKEHSSHISEELNQWYKDIFFNYSDWANKAYEISIQYKLSIADLCHPFDIFDLAKRGLIKDDNHTSWYIPSLLDDFFEGDYEFIEDYYNAGVRHFLYRLDIDTDLEQLCKFIETQICIQYKNKFIDDTSNKDNKFYQKNLEFIINNDSKFNITEQYIKNDDKNNPKKDKPKNCFEKRLWGLVIYDLLLEDKERDEHYAAGILNKIKKILPISYDDNKEVWTCNPTNPKGCKGCDASKKCQAKLRQSLYSAYCSVNAREAKPVDNIKIIFEDDRIKKFDRIIMELDG